MSVLLVIYEGVNLFESVWDDALVLRVTHHRVCLAAASLTVCENGTVVALNYRLDKRERRLIKHLSLCGLRPIHQVKCELLFFLILDDKNLITLGFYHGLLLGLELFLADGSAPNHNLDTFTSH